MTGVDRKSVEGRRELKFNCLGCLKADLDRIQAAHDTGSLRTIGNWSTGQILQHCAKLIGFAMDGFPSQAPWVVRFFFKTFLKKRALQDVPVLPGMNLPKQAAFMLPDDDVSFEQGMREMHDAVERLDAGDKMCQPSPILGDLRHDQWMGILLRHNAMHHSFIQVDAGSDAACDAAPDSDSDASATTDLIEA